MTKCLTHQQTLLILIHNIYAPDWRTSTNFIRPRHVRTAQELFVRRNSTNTRYAFRQRVLILTSFIGRSARHWCYARRNYTPTSINKFGHNLSGYGGTIDNVFELTLKRQDSQAWPDNSQRRDFAHALKHSEIVLPAMRNDSNDDNGGGEGGLDREWYGEHAHSWAL